MGPVPAPDATPGRSPRRRIAGAGVGLAVLALHAAALLALAPNPAEPGGAPAASRPAVALRLVGTHAPAKAPPPLAAAGLARPAPPADEAAAPGQAGAAKAHRAPAALRVAAQAGASAPPPRSAAARPVDGGATARAAPPATVGPAAAGASTPSPVLGEAPIPVYATRLPASLRLRFELQRGAATGGAALVWLREGDDYALSLDGELAGRPVLQATSRGGVDADGVAPLRHVERRRSRDVHAVNFRRDAGVVSFSGPQVEHPLVPGAQDRLSWLIQLPAIVAADPVALGAPGAQVTIAVFGTRGDAEAWRFDAESHEALVLPDGSTAEALRFVRQPSRPYDRRVEVWLDPGRGWLPVRLRFTPVPGGEATELRLAGVEPAG